MMVGKRFCPNCGKELPKGFEYSEDEHEDKQEAEFVRKQKKYENYNAEYELMPDDIDKKTRKKAFAFSIVGLATAIYCLTPIFIMFTPVFIVFTSMAKHNVGVYLDMGYPKKGLIKVAAILSTVAIPVGIAFSVIGFGMLISLASLGAL